MREIVFRGKWSNRLDGEDREEEWVYGFLHKRWEGETLIQTKATSSAIVEAETVGQYTGLKDKNGVRIFEGDIVVDKQENRIVNTELIDDDAGDIYSQIVFSDGSFMLLEPGHAPEVFLAGTEQDIEVIGNVFENAELLEVE